jgi:Domain of unknown function (DUF5010)
MRLAIPSVALAATAVFLLTPPGVASAADDAATDAGKPGTRFGTVMWGRNYTGQPHWLDGSVFPGLDHQSRLENMKFVPLDPDGHPAAATSDPAKLKRGRYDCALLDYWIDQARQMSAAGLDWVAMDSFGDRQDIEFPNAAHDPTQDKYIIPSMVRGIREAGVKLKICLLDDTPSHSLHHYRYELLRKQFPEKDKNGLPAWIKYRFDYKSVPVTPLPVSAEMGRRYLAEKWINAYRYMARDRDLWLTHNGLPPDRGGRPVIFMYGVNTAWAAKETMGHWHEAFAAAKQAFAEAHGVEPFLILENLYFKFDPAVQGVADGKWIWAPIAPKKILERKGVFKDAATGRQTVTGMVVPGFELKSKTIAHTAERNRWTAMDGTVGDEKHLLTTEFQLVMADPRPDFVIIGHWNDFQEGQSFGRAIYPTKDGRGTLPPDYYLTAVRSLIGASRGH